MKNLIWLVSYPKSGNTWFRMFLANYQKNLPMPISLAEIEPTPIASSSVGFEETIGLNPFDLTPKEVDMYRPEMYRAISIGTEKENKDLYCKAHDAYTLNEANEPIFPEDVSKKAIYFVRNPLDVCVSYANHSTLNIETTVNLLLNEKTFLNGKRNRQLPQKLLSWKSHIDSWQQQSSISTHFTRYEDMQIKPVETFGTIIQYLGLEDNDERLAKAIAFSDFSILQQMEQKDGFSEKMDSCNSFFWKGKIGNYRNYLSPKQVERIVEYNYDKMKEFGYIDEQGHLTV
ncbi:MAG: sulfotransferase domain-containing protein [Bacteroidales bacterium]|nr:sulfotransferase domain-containing protein [Bacteroidales bacterium]